MNIGNAIQLCRVKRKMTQGQLAKLAQCSTSYLSMLENSERVDPKLSTVKNISEALGVPVEILFFLASTPGEISGIDKELAGQLAIAALGLLNEPEAPKTSLSM
ncbi:MAG: helix-turn-helix transcriptional regulator [Pseudomonadota bacterium]|jgi:transcriptional regulator with XRE-family HTH domain